MIANNHLFFNLVLCQQRKSCIFPDPKKYNELQILQEKHGNMEGLLRFAELEQMPLEEIEVTAEKRLPEIEEIEVLHLKIIILVLIQQVCYTFRQ